MVNKIWAKCLVKPKSAKEMNADERRNWQRNVEYALSTHDIGSLKKLLPTPEDLLSFTSSQFGHHGSVLHYCMYSGFDKKNEDAEGTRLDFVKSIFQEYDLDNHPEIKQKLLLRRTMGKLAADAQYVEKIGKSRDRWAALRQGNFEFDKIPLTTNSEFEAEKIDLYHFLKQEIKAVRPKPTKEDVQVIGEDYDDVRHNPNAKGVPVTGGYYIPDADGKPAFFVMGSVKETYPEIRLRNLNKQSGEIEDFFVLKNLDPNSPKSLVSQAMDQIDFPEDFQQHFKALSYFEEGYKKIREDEGQFASIRYFTENRGNLIFDDNRDKGHSGNSKGDYAGYATEVGRAENNHSLIVIRSDLASKNGIPQTVLHEMFHRVDLHDAKSNNHFSDAPIVQFALMLAQRNNATNFDGFDTVEKSYKNIEENFNKEVVAQVMQRDKSVYKDNPLLFRLYVLGQQFSLARADGKMGMANRLKYALDGMPEAKELLEEYQKFMAEKEDHQKKIEQIEAISVGDEAKAKKAELNRQQTEERKKNNDAFTPRRQQLEKALSEKMDELIRINGKLLTHPYGEIVIPPHLLATRDGTSLPEEMIYCDVYGKHKLPLSTLIDNIQNYAESPEEKKLYSYAAYLGAKRDWKDGSLPIEPLQDIKDLNKWVSKMQVVNAYIQNPELSSKKTEEQYAVSIGKLPSDWTNRDCLNYELQLGIRPDTPCASLDYFNPEESFQRLAKEYEALYHQPMPNFLKDIQEAKQKNDAEDGEGYYTFGSDLDLRSSFQNILNLMDKRIRPELLNQMMHSAAENGSERDTRVKPRGIPESEWYMPAEEKQESGLFDRLKNLSEEGRERWIIENGQPLRTILSKSSSKSEEIQGESDSKGNTKSKFKAPIIPQQVEH